MKIEVIEILKTIEDEKRLESLPIEMLELLKSKSNPEYKPKIEIDKPLDEQNLQPETLSILSWIAFKYWKDELNIDETNIEDTNKEDTNIEENTEKINIEEKVKK